MSAEPPRAVLLLGPTASGKSGLALALAERLPLEIVSVDSALVYRGMDIGTAKPTAAERDQVPHHLIDLMEPTESYSAAAFAADATALIETIRARGRLPLLVGGTLLYAKALRDGLDDLPQADPSLRAELDAWAAREGWPALHARLAQIDPITAARLEPGDAQRIQRALEVHRLTGQPLSALIGQRKAVGAAPGLLTLALEPSERAVLHQRIATRFHQMLAAGFLDEVRALRARGDLNPELPAMRAVGYRQAWQYLDSPGPHTAGTRRHAEFVEAGIAATRQLAKRQLTWLRAMPDRVGLDALAPDVLAQIEHRLMAAGLLQS